MTLSSVEEAQRVKPVMRVREAVDRLGVLGIEMRCQRQEDLGGRKRVADRDVRAVSRICLVSRFSYCCTGFMHEAFHKDYPHRFTRSLVRLGQRGVRRTDSETLSGAAKAAGV